MRVTLFQPQVRVLIFPLIGKKIPPHENAHRFALLGSILKYGVTGGNISVSKSRLDFDMEDAVDKEYVNAELEKLVDADHPISSSWITQEDLQNNPEMIRTMSVRPPSNAEKIRLVKIGNIDLQPCGGTHVNSTAEVGKIRLGKVEKKAKETVVLI